jgi:hypothetical protein
MLVYQRVLIICYCFDHNYHSAISSILVGRFFYRISFFKLGFVQTRSIAHINANHPKRDDLHIETTTGFRVPPFWKYPDGPHYHSHRSVLSKEI